jgi:hypothetical protein
MKTVWILITAIIIFAAGVFLGRSTIGTEPKVTIIRGEEITADVPIPEPVVSIPEKPVLPVKPVYIHDTTYQVVDTAAIIADYITGRDYHIDVFDDENGKLSVDASVQYNVLKGLSYAFTPVYKEVKIKDKTVWIPFAGASYNTLNELSVSGGVFYHDIAVELNYTTDFNRKGIGIGLKKKF